MAAAELPMSFDFAVQSLFVYNLGHGRTTQKTPRSDHAPRRKPAPALGGRTDADGRSPDEPDNLRLYPIPRLENALGESHVRNDSRTSRGTFRTAGARHSQSRRTGDPACLDRPTLASRYQAWPRQSRGVRRLHGIGQRLSAHIRPPARVATLTGAGG